MKKKNFIFIIALVAVILIGTVAYYYTGFSSSTETNTAYEEADSGKTTAISAGSATDIAAGSETETKAEAEAEVSQNQTTDGGEGKGASDVEASKSASEENANQDTSDEDKDLTPAPELTVYDAEGNAIHLSDYVGRPVVINFWASWCGPCKMEMPDFNERYEALGSDVQFMMVNLTDGRNETVETANSFIKGQGYTFPVFFDQDGTAAQSYGIYSIPTTFFIDDAGNVAAQATGMVSADVLQQGIDMIYQSGE